MTDGKTSQLHAEDKGNDYMCLHLLTCGLAFVAAYLQVENAAFDREAACVVPGMRGFFFPDIFIVAELKNWPTPTCSVCWWRF